MNKKILVVDDISHVRKTLIEIYQKARYQVVGEASTGAEAIRLFTKLKPDCVTMDIVMPDMSGIEAARKIIHFDENAKIILISALGEEHLVMEAINAGVRDFLIKPFSAEEILTATQRVFLSQLAPIQRSINS